MTDSPTQILADIAERMFGVEWGASVARLANVHERTVQRIRAAAMRGEEYPAARGVLAALADRVDEFASELASWRRAL